MSLSSIDSESHDSAPSSLRKCLHSVKSLLVRNEFPQAADIAKAGIDEAIRQAHIQGVDGIVAIASQSSLWELASLEWQAAALVPNMQGLLGNQRLKEGLDLVEGLSRRLGLHELPPVALLLQARMAIAVDPSPSTERFIEDKILQAALAADFSAPIVSENAASKAGRQRGTAFLKWSPEALQAAWRMFVEAVFTSSLVSQQPLSNEQAAQRVQQAAQTCARFASENRALLQMKLEGSCFKRSEKAEHVAVPYNDFLNGVVEQERSAALRRIDAHTGANPSGDVSPPTPSKTVQPSAVVRSPHRTAQRGFMGNLSAAFSRILLLFSGRESKLAVLGLMVVILAAVVLRRSFFSALRGAPQKPKLIL